MRGSSFCFGTDRTGFAMVLGAFLLSLASAAGKAGGHFD
jgi:hypothetical protein